MVSVSARPSDPCYRDLVSYTLNHHNYSPHQSVLIDAHDPSRCITLQRARSLVQAFAAGLLDHGLTANGTVCLHMFNDIMYPIFFLGIVGAGGRFTGSNPAYTATELSHILNTSNSEILITRKAQLEVAKEAAAMSGLPLQNILIFDPDTEQSCIDGFVTVAHLLTSTPISLPEFNDKEKSTTTIVSLMSTSGTTGLPKMAARSHSNWVSENQAITDIVRKPYEVRRLLCIPFFHAFAAPLALVDALRSGHTTYVMRRFDEAFFFKLVMHHCITETAIAPPLIIRFLNMAETARDRLRSLRLVWCAGAPLPICTHNEALRTLFAPGTRINQVWGMTEGGWMSTFHHPETDATGSVGRLIAGFEAQIVNSKGKNVVGPGATGELWVRGPGIMLGYYENAQATKDTITRDGWLKTGDIGSICNGKVYLIGRSKDLIKVRGWQVAPAELEGTLLSHSDICDAAVLGVEVEHASEIPRAYVVRKLGSSITADEVKAHLLKYLARYKVADCQVRFRDSIPKSSTGKTLRKSLAEEIHKEQRLQKV